MSCIGVSPNQGLGFKYIYVNITYDAIQGRYHTMTHVGLTQCTLCQQHVGLTQCTPCQQHVGLTLHPLPATQGR
jgi:hypothetical protein